MYSKRQLKEGARVYLDFLVAHGWQRNSHCAGCKTSIAQKAWRYKRMKNGEWRAGRWRMQGPYIISNSQLPPSVSSIWKQVSRYSNLTLFHLIYSMSVAQTCLLHKCASTTPRASETPPSSVVGGSSGVSPVWSSLITANRQVKK